MVRDNFSFVKMGFESYRLRTPVLFLPCKKLSQVFKSLRKSLPDFYSLTQKFPYGNCLCGVLENVRTEIMKSDVSPHVPDLREFMRFI